MTNNTLTTNLKAYVGTYHKYNCGSLDGAWIDLTKFSNESEFWAYCKDLHKDETDPEFMIQDFETEAFFDGMISEYGIDSEIWDVLHQYEALEEWEQEGVSAYLDATGEKDRETAINEWQDHFIGCDLDEYVQEIVDSWDLPNNVEMYIDFEKLERDLSHDLISGECNNNTYYFYNH